ncbi:class I SAM-dependent methyltransferase [Pleionea sp. CnH1-48]|uniref:class I SAM-dependent methyltransferase n=1 Tax=Pleionea sp. CnH1-48 TaxID=2954494 RepID=UPI002097A336|nr:class I SAM-dependent methyltransferase [Pleionea sp. CnH1-48]MCO7226336.1 class I SAM-dependent methyltransferase [Pleionea sp. CnH1-48]
MSIKLSFYSDPKLESISQKLNLPMVEESVVNEQEWQLRLADGVLSLHCQLDNKPSQLVFDLLSGAMTYRRKHGGGRREPLAKAIGLKHNASPTVIDATAGMGRESLLLAALGCQVTAVERSAPIFALLNNALERLYASQDNFLAQDQLKLSFANSIDYLADDSLVAPDVVYMDPMFPARQKSALVKKEMRIFKQLAGEDLDDSALLSAARHCASKRVVVKRPGYAPFVGDEKPSYQIESKKHRFDVYLSE